MNAKNYFLALSNILNAAEGGSQFGLLETEKKEIIKFLAASESIGNEVCMTDITNNPAIPGAPATKLRRVHELKDALWIEFSHSNVHHRRIKVTLSEKANAEMQKMSISIQHDLNSIPGKIS
jgi:hypothetical protein